MIRIFPLLLAAASSLLVASSVQAQNESRTVIQRQQSSNALNPQPIPPGKMNELNPQPIPPGHEGRRSERRRKAKAIPPNPCHGTACAR